MPHLSPILWMVIYLMVALIFFVIVVSLEFFFISLKR